jgi:hypothetical protein
MLHGILVSPKTAIAFYDSLIAVNKREEAWRELFGLCLPRAVGDRRSRDLTRVIVSSGKVIYTTSCQVIETVGT